MHVELVVPDRSRFEWVDESGNARIVHLPVEAIVEPATVGTLVSRDSGPAAVFDINIGDGPPDEQLVADHGHQLILSSTVASSSRTRPASSLVDVRRLPLTSPAVPANPQTEATLGGRTWAKLQVQVETSQALG